MMSREEIAATSSASCGNLHAALGVSPCTFPQSAGEEGWEWWISAAGKGTGSH